ncbi:MAG: arginine--tRNA ligase, partial [Desulfobulbaceae bacterium]|nr:arginine--tRNA ligase [Desulfobulbaceae bacterium]
MIKARLKERLDQCFVEGVKEGSWTGAAEGLYSVEEPKHAAHGDFSTNMAMIIAGKEKKKPRDVAG